MQGKIKDSKCFFQQMAQSIPEIKLLTVASETPGQIQLYVLPQNDLKSLEKATKRLVEKAE